MRISDWSSDVCSSDLPRKLAAQPHEAETTLDHTLQRGRYFADCERLGVVARHRARYQPAIAAGHVIIGGRAGHEYPLAGRGDRQSVVQGKRVSVRVSLGVCRLIKKKKKDINIQ